MFHSNRRWPLVAMILALTANSLARLNAAAAHATVVDEQLTSQVLRENRIGLDVHRHIKVVLPPGYATSTQRYPVVYYLHNFFGSADKVLEDGNRLALLERAFREKVVRDFILVVADYSSPTVGSLYENSPVSGRWLDFTVGELVPFIDGKFRTLPKRESRAVVGEFFGGRGALKLAMVHSEVFSVAYALHPVATGTGELPWSELDINWAKVLAAKNWEEVGTDGRTRLFVSISQAFLPNLDRSPFYCDFFEELKDGVPTLNVENTLRTKREFHLEETLDASVANLRTMRGLALDWGAFDPNHAHVYANRQFSRKLEDLGIVHEAEEYNGNPWNKVWTEYGRVYTRVLPFLNRCLAFE